MHALPLAEGLLMPKRSAPDLGRAISLWEGSLVARRLAPKTTRAYVRAVTYLEEKHGADVDPGQLTVEDLEVVAAAWRNLSPTTVHNRIIAWREFFAWGETRYRWQNPTRLLGLPRKDSPSLRRLSVDEVSAIERASIRLQTRDRVIVNLFVHLGMRRGEVLALRWQHVDLEAREIYIDHTTAKGRKGRVVPIPDALYDVLSFARVELGTDGSARNSYVAHHVTNRPRNWLQPGAYEPDYRRPAAPLTVDRIIKRAAQLADVSEPDEVTSHQFRRALFGQMLDAGASPYIVAALAGHADIKTTAAYGGGASVGAVRDELARNRQRINAANPLAPRVGLEPTTRPEAPPARAELEPLDDLVTPKEDA